MRLESKTSFESYEIHKISGGDFLREKPVFCKDCSSLVVPNNGTCHLYSTTTGEHLSELFTCEGSIIALQIDPKDRDQLLAVTEGGKVFRYGLSSDDEPKDVCDLTVDTAVLSQQLKYKVSEKVKEGDIKFHHAIIQSGLVFASWSYVDRKTFAHVSVFSLDTGNISVQHQYPSVRLQKTSENLALGRDFLLAMETDSVYVVQLSSNVQQRHKIGGRDLKVTRIATHHEDTIFATGDTLGKIIVWRNIFENNPLRELYHWHTLPVRSLIFTECGSQMFSGGDENVLVKWSLASRMKTFLPRLSSSIHHLSTASGSALLSVTTTDNRILIINLNLACLATIQHFSRWTTVGPDCVGAILAQDPRTDALVLSGRTGHLQFLSTVDRGRFLYTFDVTQRNYITRERESKAENVEVKYARFTRCGKWLITVETGPQDARLKFWGFNDEKQEFSLNTDVDSPHGQGRIENLEVSSGELTATTGSDCTFRLWGLVETMHMQQTRLHWAQLGCGAYRHMSSGACDFARDGSLLAVSFGPALTLWETDTITLKCSLTPPLQRNPVKTVRFGNHNVSHLIITGTDSELSCWNIVTLCRQWVVPLGLELLVSDLNSCYMCAFSQKRGLFIFNPSSPQTEFSLENVCDTQVVAALFVAKSDAPYLYFLTSGQDLYCLGEAPKLSFDSVDVAKVTPFTKQLAEKSKRDVVAGGGLTRVASAQRFPASIMDGPAHALPHVALLCEDVLSSLLLRVTVQGQAATPADDQPVVVLEAADRYQLTTKTQESDLKKLVDTIFSDSDETARITCEDEK